MFLRFAAVQKATTVARLRMDDLTEVRVLAFLENIEQVRKLRLEPGTVDWLRCIASSTSSPTVNLWRLRSAPRFCDPPPKKTTKAEASGLTEGITAILAQPNRSKIEGQRDHVLLAVLYNTGARIQEALDLSPQSVRWESPFQVRLLGKGRKERHCPLWPETVAILKALLKRNPRGEDQPIFVNRYGHPLKASGVRFKLKQYVTAATRKVPSLRRQEGLATQISTRHRGEPCRGRR